MSDEEKSPSPISNKLAVNMNKISNNTHSRVTNETLKISDAFDPSVQALKELLHKEEKKLSVLKTIHGLQGAVSTNTTSSIQGSALNKTSGRSSGNGGTSRNSTNMRPAQPKHSIVVVPGNQASRSTTSSSGISNRLQQLVDNIAVDQALSSCSEKIHSGMPKGSSIKSKLTTMTAPPVPSLTSISQSNPQKHSMITFSNNKLLQLTSSSNIPQLRPKITTNKSSYEVITISDSPMDPPPLLSSSVKHSNTNGSIQVPTISSTISPSVILTANDKKNSLSFRLAAEHSRRYREYITKQTHARKIFQKQIERKMVVAPYPKTFRQVWPLIPVYDSGFVRNFGLEAIINYFDPNSKSIQEKNNSKVKPVCNQCGCDFASAWQIRKSNSKQLLLCEACDFQNLKILQRSKLSNQLKELLEIVKKDQDKFGTDCEIARKQILDFEKKNSESPPPLTSQLVTSQLATNPTKKVANAVGHVNQVVLNNQVSNRVQALADSIKTPKSLQESHSTKETSVQKQSTIVIPSILGKKSGSTFNVGANDKVGTKRPAGEEVTPPPSKVYKPGSVLDQTLNRLSRQLIKRKLDEQRQECQDQEKIVTPSVSNPVSADKEKNSPSSVPSGADKHKVNKNRRKGTPKQKRLLSGSSVSSE